MGPLVQPAGRRYVPIGGGVEKDWEIAAALAWLAKASGDAPEFFARLSAAQQRYRELTSDATRLGVNPEWADLGSDVVAAYLAQGKSLLDDRRSYDFALVSQVAPWLKQLGVNLAKIEKVEGSQDRARRMLRTSEVMPDAGMFELVMAGNYAAEGFKVAFIEEGAAKTPDLRITRRGWRRDVFVELKRLQQGQYEIKERRKHVQIFRCLEPFLHERRLSLHIDVTYDKELTEVPVDYLLERVQRAVASPIVLPGGYPWKDEFGSGTIGDADVAAVRRDTEDSYLFFGTKMARLLAGRPISEDNYHLAAHALSNTEDPRFVDEMEFGSVVTWDCIAPRAIERKARYVRSKLAEADNQILEHGRGIIHLAMDMELHSKASDLRRQRNHDTLSSFQMRSQAFAVHLHYLVPRVFEDHSWIVDETVDVFGRLEEPIPPFPAFPGSNELDNDEPAWRQHLQPPRS